MTLAVATAVADSRAKGHLVDATDLTWFQHATSTEADSEWETTEVLHGVASMSIDSFVTPVGLKEMLTPIPPRADRAANAGLASIVDREPALHACLTAASALESALLGQASPAPFWGRRNPCTLKRNTTAGPETDGRVISNGAYRSRTGDLLLAKHGFHEIEYVRRWKNRGTDALRTGRLYDTHVIRVTAIKQVADVADRRVMSSSQVGRQSVQLTTKFRSRIPERKPAPTRGRGGLVKDSP